MWEEQRLDVVVFLIPRMDLNLPGSIRVLIADAAASTDPVCLRDHKAESISVPLELMLVIHLPGLSSLRAWLSKAFQDEVNAAKAADVFEGLSVANFEVVFHHVKSIEGLSRKLNGYAKAF